MGSQRSIVDAGVEIKEQKFSGLNRQETKTQTYDERMTMEFEREFGQSSDTADLVIYKPVGVLFCFYFVYLFFALLVLPRLETGDVRIYPAHREFLSQANEATLHEDMRRSLLSYRDGQNESSKMYLTFSEDELTAQLIFFEKELGSLKATDTLDMIKLAVNEITSHKSWTWVCKQNSSTAPGEEKCADDAFEVKSLFDEPELEGETDYRDYLKFLMTSPRASKYLMGPRGRIIAWGS
mmetsp:Transcript_9668/g.14713  ORF Transcript_9668/g.14713 Transcript_9668/m.14713 type:complete len:238 (+) Transcript_9668:179-892(+)